MKEKYTEEEIEEIVEEFNKVEGIKGVEISRVHWYDGVPKFLGILGFYNLWMFVLEKFVFDGIVTSLEMLRGGAFLLLTAVIAWLIVYRSRSRK